MAKAYTTSTASYKVPVALLFTCPKCGKLVTVSKTALLSAQATVRGYNSTASGFAAQQNLAATADNQIKTIMENLEKGNLNTLLDPSGKNVNGKVVCPNCGTRQIMDVDGKHKTLYPKAFAAIIVALIFVALFVVFFAAALSAAANGQTQISPTLVSVMELVCVGGVVAAILVNRSQSRKAYSDPALMEKRYNSVLNPQMDATLMLGLGNVRTVHIRASQGQG